MARPIRLTSASFLDRAFFFLGAFASSNTVLFFSLRSVNHIVNPEKKIISQRIERLEKKNYQYPGVVGA